MSDFSKRLRELRDKRGLKQQDVSEALHFSRAMMSYYENNREPPYDTMIAMAKYFDVTTDYMLGVSPEMQPPKDEIAQALSRLAEHANDKAISSLQICNLLEALTTYCKAGAPAGDAPLLAVSDYLTHMAAFIQALTEGSAANMLSAANATAEDILAVNNIFHKAITKEE